MRKVIFNDAELLVPLDAPMSERRPWNPRVPELRLNTYIGQLKLLATEIDFLTLATNEDLSKCVIVYAGAAAGQHIPALAGLVKKTKFYLYDPAPFAIEPTEQLTIIREMFTDEVACDWGTRPDTRVIFISDVRTSGDTAEEHETEVNANMLMQARWIELLRPNLKAFSLKFRISYAIIEADLPFLYLGGSLIYQPFPKPDSMELRLLGNADDAEAGPRAVSYDSKALEQTLFYHNSVIRPDRQRYANVCDESDKPYDDPQFDNGYDCSFFLYCIKRYYERCADLSPVPEAMVLATARRMISVTSQGHWTLTQRKTPGKALPVRPRRR